MCNIAGYVGREAAVPRLIDMMRREEGFAGGYYTGIATFHEGRIYTAKVVGGLDRLLAETDAAQLPGTAGIIHSRSNGGGSAAWAHPFVSNDGKLALVLNGTQGAMVPRTLSSEKAQDLDRDGVEWQAHLPQPLRGYPLLADGSCVHFTEMFTHLTERYVQHGKSPIDALAAAHNELPVEVVSLTLHTDEPGCILAARRNMPMMLGRAEDGMYLASTAIAFPDLPFIGIEPLPICSACTIRPDGVSMFSLDPCAIPVAQIDMGMFAKAREILLNNLQKADGPKSLSALMAEDTQALWPEGKLRQRTMLWYETLRPLLADGTVEVSTEMVPGAAEGIETPAFRLSLRKPL